MKQGVANLMLNKDIQLKSATPMKLNSSNNARLQKSTILFTMFAKIFKNEGFDFRSLGQQGIIER
jgi:hypothetical protein